MKGLPHLVVFSDPPLWGLCPTLLPALCGAEVTQPTPVEAWDASKGLVPDLENARLCHKCLRELQEKKLRELNYIFAIVDKRTLHAIEAEVRVDLYAPEDFAAADPRPEAKQFLDPDDTHHGLTIVECEKAVDKVSK